MAYSFVLLDGNGSATAFNFSFGYLSRSHINVKVDLVDTAFTWLTDFSIQITPAPAAGSVIEIRRKTPLDQPAVVWTDGSTLTEQEMNAEARFNLYANQEAADGVAASISQDAEGVFDGQGRSTTNFADPTDDSGLVTKHYFDSVYTPQLDQKIADANTVIDGKVSDATTQASNASSSANTAQGYAAAADNSADAAAALLGLFKGQYLGASATVPTLDGNGQTLTEGDLYFSTSEPMGMKVYTGSAWQYAGSTIQGTISKPDFPVVATEGQTTVPVPTGYDAGFITVFLNGSKIDAPDIDVSSGIDIVFTEALTAGDEVTWVAYGAFSVADAVTESELFATAGAGRVGFSHSNSYPQGTLGAKAKQLIGFRDAPFSAIGDGVTDDTAACQAAITYAITNGLTLDVTGDFAVTSLSLAGSNGLRITGKGSLVGIATTPTPCVLDLKNVNNVYADGAWAINGNYNTNYDCGVWGYTDAAGQQCASLDLTNVTPVNCKLAWKFGNDARPDDLVSEINIRGGNTYGCPSVLLAIGAQTVITTNGAILSSLTGVGGSTWQALPQKTIVARGATINVNGGELLHVGLSTGGTGSDGAYNTLCEIQPINSPISGKIYGNITLNGVLIETAVRLATSANPSALVSPEAGYIGIIGCTGVSTQDTSAFIETDSNFTGRIQVKANNFFATSPRANVNIACGGVCDVYCDDGSFGKNFKPTLAGITGGIVHFSHRMVLNASNLNGQSLPTGTLTTLNFVNPVAAGNMLRFAGCYAGGVFTVPVGGLKNIRIETQLLKAGLAGEWYVEVNSLNYGARTLGAYNANSYSIDSLNAGDTVRIVLLNTNATVGAAAAATDWFQIFASNE